MSLNQTDRDKKLTGTCFRAVLTRGVDLGGCVGVSKGEETRVNISISEDRLVSSFKRYCTENPNSQCTHECFPTKERFDTGVRPHVGCTRGSCYD